MRLHEIDRGDSVFNRLLFGFISFASRMRLPDAARVAFYHKDFPDYAATSASFSKR